MVSVCVSRNIQRYQGREVFDQPHALDYGVVAVTFYKNGLMSHKPFLARVPRTPFHIGYTGLEGKTTGNAPVSFFFSFFFPNDDTDST